MQFNYYLADVFTDRIFGGNPLAVFLEAEGLTAEQMQAVAAELNLSETAFLGARIASEGAWPLRIFTPKVELPFAGHPTIGTAFAMAWAGMVRSDTGETSVVFQEGAGPVDVRIACSDGAPETATLTVQGPAEAGATPEPEHIAAILGLGTEDIGFGSEPERLTIRTVSLGVPFTLVPVRDRGVLACVRVDLAQWRERLADTWAPHLYVFTGDAERPGVDIRARMFAPAMGIDEDPATGAAAAALAGYLASESPSDDGDMRWTVEQGIEMGRPSNLKIGARWRGDHVSAVEVGGGAVKVGEGRLHIPTPRPESSAEEE